MSESVFENDVSLEAIWQSFRAHMIQRGHDAEILDAAEPVFYAGFGGCLAVVKNLGKPRVSVEKASETLASLERELWEEMERETLREDSKSSDVRRN